MKEAEVSEVAAAVTYNPEKDRFLLVKRSSTRKRFPNEWEFASGFIEENEEGKDAALRELKEETGLIGEVIKTGEPFEVNTEMHHFRVHPVLVKVDSREVDLTEEHEDFEWVEVEEIEKYNTVPQLRKDLKRIDVI